jgi:microcystin-dependent protein
MFSVKFRELIMSTPGMYEELDAFYKRLTAFLSVAHNEDGTLISPAPAQVSDLGLAVGTVVPYAGSSVPTGWLLCDGTAVSRSTYSTLFSVLGTTYGAGNGTTTFNVPDLRQRFPLGKAASGTGATLGATGGLIDHTHTGPSHTHTGPSHTHTGPSHTHTGPAHTHDTVVPITGYGTNATPVSGAMAVSDGGALPAGIKVANAAQTVTSTSSGTGATGASGTGATGADGTGATGSSGAGNTGAENPPFLSLNYIVLYA